MKRDAQCYQALQAEDGGSQLLRDLYKSLDFLHVHKLPYLSKTPRFRSTITLFC